MFTSITVMIVLSSCCHNDVAAVPAAGTVTSDLPAGDGFVIGNNYTLSCAPTVADSNHTHWKWDNPAATNDATFMIQATAIEVNYKCSTDDASPVNPTTYGVAFPVQGAADAPTVTGGLATYTIDTSYNFTCVSTFERAGIIYEWTKNGNPDTTKTSKTISVIATSNSTIYSCQVKIGSSGKPSPPAQDMTVVAVAPITTSTETPKKTPENSSTHIMASIVFTSACVLITSLKYWE